MLVVYVSAHIDSKGRRCQGCMFVRDMTVLLRIIYHEKAFVDPSSTSLAHLWVSTASLNRCNNNKPLPNPPAQVPPSAASPPSPASRAPSRLPSRTCLSLWPMWSRLGLRACCCTPTSPLICYQPANRLACGSASLFMTRRRSFN